jgi:hypothetical protein
MESSRCNAFSVLTIASIESVLWKPPAIFPGNILFVPQDSDSCHKAAARWNPQSTPAKMQEGEKTHSNENSSNHGPTVGCSE